MIVVARSLVVALVLLVAGCVAVPVAERDPVAAAFRDHRSDIQVTATGTVTRILTDDDGPRGAHQRFILQLVGSQQTLLVLNNLTVGRRVPLRVGDTVKVHGEYIWNEQGGLVHFTHHDADRSHEGGWIEHAGVRYE